MPHTVSSLLAAAGLVHAGVVKWQTPIPSDKSGLYIISTTASPDAVGTTIADCPLCHDTIKQWMHDYGICIDGRPATISDISARIAFYWMPSEPVLYIGQTNCVGGLCTRTGQFYTHILGRKSPHKGGQWLKTLKTLDQLYVHWALSDQPKDDESDLIGHFCTFNPKNPFPFANQEWREAGRLHRRKTGLKSLSRVAMPNEAHG